MTADSWSLTSITGGVVSGDLVGSGANATFTGHLLGSAVIRVVSGALTATDSGTLTVLAGAATQTRVETAANGSGAVVSAQNVTAGNSITVYAITRDANGNFVANPSATWSLQNSTGGVVSGDLTGSGANVTFTGHLTGTTKIQAIASTFTGQSGVQTVVVGAASQTRVETAADGSGSVVSAQNITAGNSITVYAISRDVGGNYLANPSATWSLQNSTGGVVSGDLTGSGANVTFTGHLTGTTKIQAIASTFTGQSGVQTVVVGAASQTRVETAADGSGSVVSAQNITAGNSITVYAISRDVGGNYLANPSATWSLQNSTGGIVSGDLVANGANATFTGQLTGTAKIQAIASTFTGQSGTQTVIAGAATQVRVETAANGSGVIVPAQNVTAGSSVTVYAITRDTFGNFVANPSSTWSLISLTGGVVSGDLAASGANAMFSGNLVGSATIRVVNGSFNGNSGTQTVIVGPATKLAIQTQPSSTAIAGQTFAQQPVIQIQDSKGNVRTADNSTVVTAARGTGTGTLQGTLTATAVNGVATFSNLNHTKAETITVAFSASGLTGATSGNVAISAAPATKLVFTTAAQSLTTGAASATITVQRQDQYNNPNSSDATISVALSTTSSGTFTPVSPVAIANGASSVNFTYTDSVVGTPTITASAAPLTAATQVETVNAATGAWIRTTLCLVVLPVAASGNWSTSANWGGGLIPDGPDTTADFSTLDASALCGNPTVTIDTTSRTVGALEFGDTSNLNTGNYTLTASGGAGLTLQTTVGTPSITLVTGGGGGNATISAPLAGTQGFTLNGNSFTLTLTSANNYSGTTTVSSGTLAVQANGGLGSGNVSVANGAALTLGTGSSNPTATYVASTARVLLAGTATVNLNFTGTDTIAALSFDGGSTFQAVGTWGSTSSTAAHKDSHFSGSGILQIVSPTTTALVSSVNPSTYNQSVTFTATVSPVPAGTGVPTGTVTFKDGATTLGTGTLNGSGVATFSTSALTAGGSAHSVTAVYATDGNFLASTSPAVSQTVNRATPTVSVWPTASGITYGQALSASTLSGGSASVPGTFAFTAPSTTPVAGTYSAAVTFTPTDTANYTTVAGSVNVAVAKATPVITWNNPANITYGTALSAGQLNATTPVAGSFAYNPASGTVLNAGNGQALSATFTPTDTVNYNTATATVSINVTKASLTVTANNASKIYGAANPTFSASYSGFVNGDTSSVLSGSPSLTTTATTSSPVGSYTITAAVGTLSAANYTFTYVNGTLTVNPATLSITPDGSKSKTYGQVFSAFTGTVSGLQNSDAVSVTYASTGAGATAGVGSYDITVASYNFTTGSAANYTITQNTATGGLTVNTASLTITAKADSKTYGQTKTYGTGLVAATYATISGLQNSDAIDTLTITDTDSGGVTTAAAGGTYHLTPSVAHFSTGSSANYSITYNTGLLTVGQAALTVTATGPSKAYGTALTAGSSTVNFSTAVLLNSDAVTSVTLTPNAAGLSASTAAGSAYVVTPSAAVGSGLANYSIVYVAYNGTVGKATPTVVVTPYTVTYDGNPHTATVTSITGVNGETGATVGTVTLSTTHTAAGTYSSDSWSFTGTANYNNIGSTTITDTINKVTPTVTVTVGSYTYNGSAQGPNSYATSPAGDTGAATWTYVGVSGTTYGPSTTQPTAAGSYTATVSLAADSNNNTASSSTTGFTINKATATVVVTPYTVAYDGSAHTATYTISGVNSETGATVGTVTLSTTHTAAGTYSSDSWSFTGTANYNNIASTTITDTISVATPTVSVWPTASGITYGQALSASTLSGGSASVAGNFTFTTPSTTPGAGTYSAAVTFTPNDTANYTTVSGSVNVAVAKATPVITWNNPADITYGTALSGTQLNASSGGVAGNFVYTPASGTVLSAGNGQTLSAQFTPSDTANYNIPSPKTVSLNVGKATPTITTLPTASGITYGQALSASTLSGGSASVAGTFAFTAPSTMPSAGTYSAAVTFTPNDTANYTTVAGSVNVAVAKVTPTLSVANSPVTYNGAARTATINSSVAGTVSNVKYDGSATAPTAVGTYAITADFAPTDSITYTSLTGAAAGTFVIQKATPTLSVGNSPVTFSGSPQAATVNGSVAGTASNVKYNGSATVPTAAGTYTITADFAPTDSANYNSLTGAAAGNFVINLTSLVITASAQSKTYGTAIALGTTAFTTSGLLPGDSVTSVTLSSNGGTAATDAAAGYTIAASAAVGTGLSNYLITYQTGVLTVNPLVVQLTGGRIYDGTATAAAGIFTIGNKVSGDTLTLSGSATVASKNIGTRSITSFSGLTLGGASAGNYTFTGANGSVSIATRLLTVTATGQNKNYDGNTTATVTLADDRASGDSLTLGYTSATFADSAIGGGKIVTVTGITVTGSDAGNYTFNGTTTTTADITGVPVVTTHPASQLVPAGTPVAFNAVATSGATVQWEVSANGGTSYAPVPGAAVIPLTLTVSPADNGKKFRAKFSNAFGTTPSNPADLTVPADNISSQVTVTRGALTYNYTTQRFVQMITVKNNSAASIQGVFSLALDSLSGNASLYNKTGNTSAAAPSASSYIDLSAASLSPGATTTISLQFVNPTRAAITYTPRVLGGPGAR
ncbi:MAG: MBG domain-containing protein [Verrucomicrobiota bacterium]